MTETDEMALDERAPKEVAVDHQFLEMGLSWLSSARQEGAIASMVDDLTEYLRMHFDAEQRRGGFFDMGASPATVWQTVTDADGAQASRRALFGGKPVTGAQRYVFDRAAEAAGLQPGLEVAFEKVGARGAHNNS